MYKRIVVTGLGIVSPIGNDLNTAWNASRNGVSGIDLISKFDPEDLRSRMAGEVKNFEIPSILTAKDAKRMDTFTHYAIAATQQALDDAQLKITDENAYDVGVSLGGGIGGQATVEDTLRLMDKKGTKKISPFFIPMILGNMSSGQVSLTFGTKNYTACTYSACAASSHAIGDGARIIERGDAKVMIVGGAESALTKLCLGGFSAMKALSTRNDDPARASRPYDQDRDGFVFSEGAGILILEELEHAQARGAHIYCELSGYGFSSDAHHISAPTVEGPSRSISLALKDSGLNIEDVDYINTHATSTPIGDINELRAIKSVFNKHANKLSISSSKSMMGHLLGAAGAVEAVITVKAMEQNFVPPTINIENLDPECDVDVTPNVGKERELNVALSNSFGFGGTNATLVFKKL